MNPQNPIPSVLDALTRNLVLLAAIAPDELRAVAVLVEAALKRHLEK